MNSFDPEGPGSDLRLPGEVDVPSQASSGARSTSLPALTVDWPKIIDVIHELSDLTWGKMAAQLVIGEEQLTRARRSLNAPGHVLAGRLLALAIERGIVADVFTSEILKSDKPRVRYGVGMPMVDSGDVDSNEIRERGDILGQTE